MAVLTSRATKAGTNAATDSAAAPITMPKTIRSSSVNAIPDK